ncbi:hypothetical protein [Streptomyces sp. NPDC057582]|uniref:hypothetical protein n=1 Tax=Streptomyces sp. NPDC057582 TaxID=3346174 RepID=UPI0036C7969F
MITIQPVLEIPTCEGFDLWPIAEIEPYAFLALHGALPSDQVGSAVMALAACNDLDPGDDRPPRPEDRLGSFLHGLLTMDPLFASGGFQVTDTAAGTRLVPGCCSGLEDRGDWWEVLDGDSTAAWFGHDPSPAAEHRGSTIHLTVDTGTNTSARIQVQVSELRRLLAGAEQDLIDFLHLATHWAASHLPDHSERVHQALARALTLPPRN